MKLIIAGTRDLDEVFGQYTIRTVILKAVSKFSEAPTEIVSGHSGVVDRAGEDYALFREIPCRRFPYKSEYGKAGGPIRNQEMAEYADALLLIWDGKSKGSRSMLREARKAKLPIGQVVLSYEFFREN